MICDFCSDPQVYWLFDAPDIKLSDREMRAGAWAACRDCYVLICADQREYLAVRTLEMLKRKHPFLGEMPVHAQVKMLHHKFFDHWTGGGKPA